MLILTFCTLLLFLFNAPFSRAEDYENNTKLETSDGKFRTDITTLEEALVTLSELTSAQKQVWDQQEAHREQMQATFALFTEKDLERSRALEKEQNMLKEIRGKLSRKLKTISKAGNGHITSGQSNCNGYSSTEIPPKDCAVIFLNGEESSGVYKVWPTWTQPGESFLVYCDMYTDGGGWTVIYRKESIDIPENYFERNWVEYTNGFGDLATTFWLGTRKMHQLTSQGSYELRFDFQDDENQKSYSLYRTFRVDGDVTKYVVHVEGYDPSGTAGDIFISASGANFSTYDENSLKPELIPERYDGYYRHYSKEYRSPPNCANNRKTGWWFKRDCGVHPTIQLNKTSQSRVEMKIRPMEFSQKDST